MKLIGPFPSTVAPVRDGVYQIWVAGFAEARYSRFVDGRWLYCQTTPERAERFLTLPSTLLRGNPFTWYGVAK